jgi:hypothetical protein
MKAQPVFNQHKASQNEDYYYPSLPPCNGGIFSPTHHQAAKVTSKN